MLRCQPPEVTHAPTLPERRDGDSESPPVQATTCPARDRSNESATRIKELQKQQIATLKEAGGRIHET